MLRDNNAPSPGIPPMLRHPELVSGSTTKHFIMYRNGPLRINPCVYIMSNEKHGTMYIGVTNNILRRSWEHAEGETPSFTQRYGLNRLVYYQHFDTMLEAITEEKRLKRWHREWKINLIEKRNPEWKDLFDELT